MKVCTKCGKAKPFSEFHKRACARDGLTQRCKPCGVAATRASQDKNPAAKRAWYEANKDRVRDQTREWAARNPEKKRAYFRAWYARNAEAQRKRAAEWSQRHPERNRATQQRRIARQKAAAGAGYTTADHIAARAAVFGGCCYYCGAPAAKTVDHRIPLARGGSHWPANLVPACGPCNFRKGTMTEREFTTRVAA